MARSEARLGLVGAGYWARAAHLPSLRGADAVRWTALCSRDAERARHVAREFDVPAFVTDWRDLVARDDVDGVVVATPCPEHAAITHAAIEAGKHVLCEAPLAMDADQARGMLAAATEAGLIHAYVRPRPFLYGGARVFELIEEGALGEVQNALLSWRGNPWLRASPAQTWRVRADMGPPVLVGVTVAVLHALLGPLARVGCTLQHLHAPREAGAELAPDYFAGLLVTQSGVHVGVQAGYSQADVPGSGLQLFGTEATLIWEWSAPPRIRLSRSGDPQGADPAGWIDVDYPLEPDLAKAWPHTRELGRAIVEGRPALPDFATGVAELESVGAVLRSARREAWIEV